MKRQLFGAALASGCLAIAGPAAGHELDHPAPSFGTGPAVPTFQSGGEGAQWELVTSIATGNPHTDLDFFTQGGNTFASVGTLGIGPNAGGQTILQLTDGDTVRPRFVSGAPTASCVSDPTQALGLQHDVEATPKGGAILNIDNPAAVRSDTQLVVDATDNPGRCHDQGVLGIENAPPGGLEIIDVTNVSQPETIGLTSHIGEAHTVNIDPKRPHIAYAVTSDAVGVDAQGKRTNENQTTESGGANADRNDLDGFEVVDLSSCMNFPPGTSLAAKRASCRPQVYRFRYPSASIALGHTLKTGGQAVFGCHELELYPNDLLTCGSGNAGILFDMAGAFDDRGTPTDFTDDKPRGTPLPCRVRPSSSAGIFATAASVTDCVEGEGNVDLRIPNWLKIGAPALEGVRHLGSAFHQGRGAGTPGGTGVGQPAFDSTEDIDFNHEAELTASGRFILATDERGGGVLPPGATCSQGVDLPAGNGGIHAYAVGRLQASSPSSPEEAFDAYARTPDGDKAIYRARIRTGAEPTVCTAHVFQQIPGQNRIFMGWYSQGTQVVDFVERPDGTIEFEDAGFFIPQNANTWVSHVFKVEENADGTVTYYGATGDFALGARGRNAIDVYKVTLPAPPKPVITRGSPSGCVSATRSRRVRVKRRRGTTITATLTVDGRPLEGARVRARGPGFRKRATTNSRGRARFRVRPSRSGRATVSTSACNGRLSVRVRSAQVRRAPRFTG